MGEAGASESENFLHGTPATLTRMLRPIRRALSPAWWRRKAKRQQHAIAERLHRNKLPSPQVSLSWELLGDGSAAYAVCTEKLHAGCIVYSCGVGNNISFDLAIIEEMGADVFAFDRNRKSFSGHLRSCLRPFATSESALGQKTVQSFSECWVAK